MTSFTRQLLSDQAPMIIRELREAFEVHEGQLLERAEKKRSSLKGVLPDTIRVPFHFDQFKVYAIYRVREKLFSKLIAYAGDDAGPHTFSLNVYLTY